MCVLDGDVILPCPEIANEGALWFPDLTVADPTLIIPFAVGIFNLTNIEVSINIYHKYNKILKSDWLSAVLVILALLGQCNWTVHSMSIK